jgi:hypothetical protein
MSAVAQKYLTYTMSLQNLKSVRYAINRRLLVLAEKLRAASTPEKVERYRHGAADLTSLQNLIAEALQKERSMMRLALSERQSGIILHALRLTHEEKKTAVEAGGIVDLRDVDQLESLAETEKMFKDALPVAILLQVGYGEHDIQAQLRTVF